MGAALSPFNAFQILQGIETLGLRMDRINENTLTVAKFLEKHSKVAWVNYAGLPNNQYHKLAQHYMNGKASGLMTFGVKSSSGSGREAGARFLDALKLFTRLVNIGDAKSLATTLLPQLIVNFHHQSLKSRALRRTRFDCVLALNTSTTSWLIYLKH
jgi:O-acetylhomoserine (thiol)-lyase